MADVEFRCPKCTKRYKTNEEHSGKKTKCSGCGELMEVPFPPLEIPDEVTSGGSTVYRHEARSRDFEMAIGDSENIERISDHIEKHIGPIESVWHELVSDIVHIDVHWVKPTDDRPFHTLVTSGMSDLPMSPPEGAEALRFTELMICLPPDWKLDEQSLEDPANFWPIYWLKYMARFPHEYETWIFDGHTIPNGDPPDPIDDSLGFIGWLVSLPMTVEPAFIELEIDDEKTIFFLAIYPLYQKEMDFKLAKGNEKLMERFEKHGYCEVVEVDRKDVTKKRFGLF